VIRSLRILIASTLLVAGAVASFAGPAEAEPPGGCHFVAGHSEQAGSYIHAYRYWACETEIIPLHVTIERYLSPDVYETVAEGEGQVTYYCRGTLYNVYRTTVFGPFGILCT